MISRRIFLATQAAWAAGVALRPHQTFAATAHQARFQTLYDGLAAQMRRLYDDCRIEIEGRQLLRPCNNPAYVGLWHDDFTWPHIGLPELKKRPQMKDALAWLTEAMIDLPVVADRIEYDGTAVMSPGGASAPPMSESMPIHLPAAWTRLLSYAAGSGLEIPRRKDWARLIARSFERVHFSFGLVWNDPQRTIVAFGFQDSIRLTGLVLLTSLVIKRGLERAADLFADDLPEETIRTWRTRAAGIEQNLYRLFDEKAGGFVGATRAGRAFDVWGNGAAWPYATAPQRAVIEQTLRAHQDRIFLKGCTRQVIGPGGWPGTARGVDYQNGGYWGTGTGFVLPMLAEIDPDWALKTGNELLQHLDEIKRAEWLDQQGKPRGALEFLGTLSMPLIGLRAILEGKPVLSYL